MLLTKKLGNPHWSNLWDLQCPSGSWYNINIVGDNYLINVKCLHFLTQVLVIQDFTLLQHVH